MQWSDFAGKKIALLGAGVENMSLIAHLEKVTDAITVADALDNANTRELSKKYPELSWRLGEIWLDHLDQFDVVFRTPGLPVDTLHQAVSTLTHPPKITSAMDLFFALAPCRIVGVTGTKGKGTTSTMIGSILEASGWPTIVAGNIGRSIYDDYDKLTAEMTVVMELSSFQLQDVTHSPQVAVLLAVTPDDHLQPLSSISPNYHHSFEEYVAAKAAITLHQHQEDTLVYFDGTPELEPYINRSLAKKLSVSQDNQAASYYLSPEGQVSRHGEAWLDLPATGLVGEHVWLNAAYASAVADSLKISKDHILVGLKKFKPLPHRMEKFLERSGVEFVDDSYATTPSAAIAAVRAYQQPIVWIAGGSTKGADFAELAKVVSASTVQDVLLLGQEAPKIAQALEHFAPKVPYLFVPTLSEAVDAAITLAKPGSLVLLSPACASKDMFTNALDRGNQFQQLIHDKLL